jgi:hypothetical protein
MDLLIGLYKQSGQLIGQPDCLSCGAMPNVSQSTLDLPGEQQRIRDQGRSIRFNALHGLDEATRQNRTGNLFCIVAKDEHVFARHIGQVPTRMPSRDTRNVVL